MPDKPFVINDRRKFTAEGELRPDAPHEEPKAEAKPEPQPEPAAEAPRGPQLVTEASAAEPAPTSESTETEAVGEDQLPPPPTAEQSEQASRAYDATVERLDTAVRAMDPGAQHAPPMTFERLVQSLYMQALIQLGGVTEPGQPVRVDLMGARSTIDMLAVIADKAKGNLTDAEDKLLQSALFELRLAFLDVTQALAQQAAKRQGPTPPGAPPIPGGPSIVR